MTQLEILYFAHEHTFNEFMKYCDEYENSNFKDADAKFLRDTYYSKMFEISKMIKAEREKIGSPMSL